MASKKNKARSARDLNPRKFKKKTSVLVIDKVEFIEITRARRIIHPDQAALLDRLQRHLDPANRTPAAEKTSA